MDGGIRGCLKVGNRKTERKNRMDYSLLASAFGAFFAIVNPFVNLPLYLALTSDYSITDQRKLALKVTIYSTIICMILLVLGKNIIGLFGVSIDGFRIAGGLILAGISWSMLHGLAITPHHGSDAEQDHLAELSNLAFYPITFPMIAGPGTMATIIIFTGQSTGYKALITIGVVIIAVLLLLFVVFYFASYFDKILSDKMKFIMTRIMGMILLAISVEMTIAGPKSVLPGLA